MIYTEDQTIKLGGAVLPGLVKSIEVTENALIDEQEVEGSAVKPKQATGYEDARITIELIIDDTPTQTRFQRYAVLRALFRQSGQSVPQPISIVCEDTAAHGIDKVLFKKLTHKGENKKDQLTASLELWEYIPQTITATKRSSSSASSNTSSSGSASSGLSESYTAYLSSDRGTSPMTAKRSESPAVDDAGTAQVLSKVASLPS